MDIFDAALIKMFYHFVKTNGGPSSSSTPIETAIVNNKQFVSVRQGQGTLTKLNAHNSLPSCIALLRNFGFVIFKILFSTKQQNLMG